MHFFITLSTKMVEAMMDEVTKQRLIENFRSNHINVEVFDSLEDAKERILDVIPASLAIGIGNSITLKKMNLSKILNDRGNIVYDKTLAKTSDESKILKKKSLLADWYISGTNAISTDGHIVNIDHSGNRVAAMLYGPDHVIIVVGINKIVGSLDEAINRAKNIAAPLNAKRAGHHPPCVKLNKCIDCHSNEKVCNSIVIIKGQENKERMRLFIVNEEVGY